MNFGKPSVNGHADAHEGCRIAIDSLKSQVETLTKQNETLHAHLAGIHGVGGKFYQRVLGNLNEEVDRVGKAAVPDDVEPDDLGPRPAAAILEELNQAVPMAASDDNDF